ncbi:MAG TPA: hypothetical protein VGC60_11760 [Pyrinomonadaceae bacterium]|jgi:hypothetical protein
MDRRQISWLIVRAFGVYLLVQAFILLPELLAGLFTARYYSNVMSSLGSETGSGGSFTRVMTSMYRTMAVAPLIRIILYSAAGIYMVCGGRFVVRLLERSPDNPTDVDSEGDAQQMVEREPR